MAERYVLYHPEFGIFLGEFLGLGFWSLEDPVGQDAAVTFESREAAQEILNLHPAPYREQAEIRPVQVEPGSHYITVEECVAAGLPAWDPDGGK